jgi:hypothetical protein
MPIIPLSEAQPGDLVAFNTRGMFGRLIQLGQWLRRADRPFRRWHHIAVIVDHFPDATGHGSDGDPADPASWIVVQAARRVDKVWLDDVSPNRPFAVLRCPDGVNRSEVVAQANALIGAKYGILSVLSIAFNLLTPKFVHVDWRRDSTWICSALGAWCLHAGGWLHPWSSIYEVLPADLAVALA